MSALVKQAARFVETEIDDEIVVMELDRGEFFSLAGTAAAIWRLIDGERSRTAVLASLAAEFGEPESALAGELDAFLGQLRDAGLIAAG